MPQALQRRILPFAPLSLEVENGDGSSFVFTAKLTINYNVLAEAQEKCGRNFLEGGLDWVDKAEHLKALFWASMLPYQKELRADENFEIVSEYLDLNNRLTVIEALLGAWTKFIRKDKRQEFQDAANTVIEYLKTGKAPEAKGVAESPLAVSGQNPSDGGNSSQSPATISESVSENSAA